MCPLFSALLSLFTDFPLVAVTGSNDALMSRLLTYRWRSAGPNRLATIFTTSSICLSLLTSLLNKILVSLKLNEFVELPATVLFKFWLAVRRGHLCQWREAGTIEYRVIPYSMAGTTHVSTHTSFTYSRIKRCACLVCAIIEGTGGCFRWRFAQTTERCSKYYITLIGQKCAQRWNVP